MLVRLFFQIKVELSELNVERLSYYNKNYMS